MTEDWRKDNVTSDFKKVKEEPGNYRLVSLNIIPENIIEQFILNVISKQVEENKLTGSSQRGFINGESCLTNMVAFYDTMTAE